QGRDLSGALRGWDFERPGGALYLRMPSTAGREDWRGWRTADRLLVCRGGQHGPVPMHLYDLAEDPWQLRDVLSARPAEAERLRSELIAALAAVGDPWSRDAGARTTATAASTRWPGSNPTGSRTSCSCSPISSRHICSAAPAPATCAPRIWTHSRRRAPVWSGRTSPSRCASPRGWR